MTVVELILIALATARLTRLVTTDVLTESARNWMLTRLENWPKIQYLIVCEWCASMYTGAVVTGSWLAWHGQMWFMGALALLAASYVAGFLAAITETGE